MKKIFIILLTISIVSSCAKDIAEKFSDESVPVNYTFNLATTTRSVVTRSLAPITNENSVSDLNVFIFDALTGDKLSAQYFNSGSIINNTISINGTSGSRIFAFIANVGASLDNSVTNLDDLKNLKKNISSGVDFLSNGKVVMSALTDVKVVTAPPGTPNPRYNLGTIYLDRLTAKVTVVIEKSGLEPSTIVTVRSVQLKNVPKIYSYINPNSPTTATTTFVDGDNITVNDGNLEPIDPTGNNRPHDYATPLYLVENMQGTRSIPTNVAGQECTSSMTQIPTNPERCSYIEVVCEYRTTLGVGEQDGLITYKVYLGKDLKDNHWNNFDVMRNLWYQVTLTLIGRAGNTEASWRVTTDLTTHHNDDRNPWGAGGFAYTIDPSDSYFWSIASPYQNTAVKFSEGYANALPMAEYSEGRGVTFINGISPNFTAIRQCWRLNGERGIILSLVDKIEYFLPSQNQIQMMNVFFNPRVFPTGLFWSSTQLMDGIISSNQYARAVSHTNYGEAQTYFSTIATAYPRCLMEPDRTFRFEVEGVSSTSNKVYYPIQTTPNIKTYPYYQSGTLPVIINRESWNYGGSLGVLPRGVISISLRIGAPYDGLTTNYHTVRRPYSMIRIAKSDCDKNGNPITNNATTQYTMNWYEALGYTTPTGSDPATPTINGIRTGCNAYSERSDKSDLGKWRVPTSLELVELWIMGAGVGGTTAANPNYTYALLGIGSNILISTPRLSRLSVLYPMVKSLWGDTSTITNNITNISYVWPGGSAVTPYNLSKLYWSSNTSPNTIPANAFTVMVDFFSGDSYTGSGPRTAGFPRKKGQGMLRCVKDVTEETRYLQ